MTKVSDTPTTKRSFGGCRILLPIGPSPVIELWPGQWIVDTSGWVEKPFFESSGVWDKPVDKDEK